jgi:hypothetical protein
MRTPPTTLSPAAQRQVKSQLQKLRQSSVAPDGHLKALESQLKTAGRVGSGNNLGRDRRSHLVPL